MTEAKTMEGQDGPVTVAAVRRDLESLGADFARDTGLERVGAVGRTTTRLRPQRALVDYGVEWLCRRLG